MLIFFDTETTGLPNFKLNADDPSQPRIAALAAILCDDKLNVRGLSHCLIKPEGWSMPEDIAKINGLSDDILRESGVPIRDALAVLHSWLHRGCTIVAHNVQFDLKMLRGELRRLDMPDYYDRTYLFCTQMANISILKLEPKGGKRHADHFKYPNLGETFKYYFDKEMGGAHGAYNDALAVKRIYGEMLIRKVDMTPKAPKGPNDATMAPRPQSKAVPKDGTVAKDRVDEVDRSSTMERADPKEGTEIRDRAEIVDSTDSVEPKLNIF